MLPCDARESVFRSAARNPGAEDAVPFPANGREPA
jgi:hypothetical protein